MMSKGVVEMGEREVEWFVCYEKRQNWRLQGGEEQPDVRVLRCHLRPWPMLLLRPMSVSEVLQQ